MQFIGFGKVYIMLMQVSFPSPILKIYIVPNVYKNKTQRKKGKRNSQFHFLELRSLLSGRYHLYRATSWSISGFLHTNEILRMLLSGRYLPYRADTGLHFLHFSPTFFSGANYRALIGPISLLSGTFYFVFSSNSLPPWTFGTGYVETNNPHTCCLLRTHRLLLKNLKSKHTLFFFLVFFFQNLNYLKHSNILGLPPGSALFKVKARLLQKLRTSRWILHPTP